MTDTETEENIEMGWPNDTGQMWLKIMPAQNEEVLLLTPTGMIVNELNVQKCKYDERNASNFTKKKMYVSL